jgi:hypothetical protein
VRGNPRRDKHLAERAVSQGLRTRPT